MPQKTDFPFLKGIKPRRYQQEILKTCLKENCLVVLPTGIGKTLIALMLTIKRMQETPTKKVVFLAPTRPLVEQHYNYFTKHLPELFADFQIFTGKIKAEKRKKIWKTADIIFSTPQCVANDLKKGLYDLKNVSLLIEDEAHRCLKKYSYMYIAEKYKQQSENIRILGLTASPGSEKQKISKICENLGVKKVEVRTRESNDVKPYLQKLEFEAIKLEFPEEFKKIKKILKKIYDKKIDELINRKLFYGPKTKKNLLETQKKIMKSIISGNKNFNMLKGASVASQALKLQHSLELLETQTLSGLQRYLQELFDQAAKQKSKGVQQLVKKPEFNQAYTLTNELLTKKIENPKINKLKSLIKEELEKNSNMKAIIFAQFRETVTSICKNLNEIPGIRARVFVGQAKKKSGKGKTTGLNQKQQQEIIKKFALGEINILCATSIGEEGLDIPEVHEVIFYEPIPSAIRKIQRAGRTARLLPGKLKILMTKGTRDESYYWAAFHKEKKMYKALKNINKNLQENKKTKNLDEFIIEKDNNP